MNDWSAFQEAVNTPRPDAFRLNSRKTSPNEFLRTAQERNLPVRQSEYFDQLFYWEGDGHASKTLSHWCGHFYIQDPVTLIPVELLNPGNQEVILDMCSAPGGKTFYLSEKVGPAGTVIANDPNPGRRKTLNGNVQRMGTANVIITPYDGQSLPENRSFKSILVDAPCSGEGTVRHTSRAPVRSNQRESEKLSQTQWQLLRKAYTMLRQGGRLVYATCTFAPEENEAVVDRLINETDAQLITPDRDLPRDPGVTSWENETYDSDVKKLWRCYPHHYDGGGIVVATIEKPG